MAFRLQMTPIDVLYSLRDPILYNTYTFCVIKNLIYF